MPGLIQPPIFVRYTNGGLVAFESLFEAEDQVPRDSLDSVAGIWDAIGQRLAVDPVREFTTRFVPVQQPIREGAELRTVLSEALTRTGDADTASASLAELAERAYWRFSLLDEATVNAGRFFKWFDAVLAFLGYAPR